MKAQDLKNSILQLAIQGKLVPQDPNDEPADILYVKIQSEKQKLIKEGKIKKDKPLPPITDDEIPFAIPSTWKWVRFGDIIFKLTDGTHSTPKYTNQGVPFISVKDLSSGYINFSNTKFISEEEHNILSARCNPEKGDLLLTKVGTTGIPVIVDTDREFSLFVSVALVKLSKSNINLDFLKLLILSPLVQEQVAENTKGVGNKNWVIKDIANTFFPLPPFAEQKRIVDKIEELEPLVKQYDKAETELSVLNDSFPEQLKKSILQYAIQGKLVPQDANDELAEVLYAKIQAEKQKLIKEGKIKKDKPLPPITDDEIPFAIPSTWKWVRLGDIFAHNTGKALNSSKQEGKFKRYITTSNVYWNYFKLDEIREMRFNDDEIQKCTVTKGDLLVCEGGDIGRAAIWNYDYDICIQNHIHRLKAYSEVCTMFFYYIFFLYKMAGYIGGKGIGIQGLSSGALHNIWVPLPPLAEQKRIVAKVNELMQYCEELTHPEKRKEVESITIEWLIDKGFASCQQNGYTDVNAILDELKIAVMQDRNLKKGRIEYDNNKKKFQIWVNDLNDNWTKAHELVHYVNDNNEIKLYGAVGRKDETSLSKTKERNVDALTAEILMPEDIFISAVEQDNIKKYAFVDNAVIRKLGKQFRVSDDAVKIRLQNLGYHTK